MPLQSLFRNAERQQSVAAGEVVFAEGDPGGSMYGIIDGAIELRKGTLVVAAIGPGEVFGEMALVDRSPRSLTAVATVDTTLGIIDARRFLFLVHETPTFALEVMSTMASRLRTFDNMLSRP
jgi:CRP/FNR family cyclic AMP-dependent transcriptional regulator